MSDFFAGLWSALLRVQIIDGPVPVVAYALAAVGLAVTLLWRPTRRSLLGALLGAVAGVLVAVGLWAVCIRWLNLFGVGLGLAIYALLAATLAGAGVAVAALFRRGKPRGVQARRSYPDASPEADARPGRAARGGDLARRVVAAVTVVAVMAAGTLAINAVFGLNRTLGNLLNIVVEDPLALPEASASDTSAEDAAAQRLWSTWTAPADMPAKGTTGTVAIPNTASGFNARNAGVYLPPAALTASPPKLPVVLMMMGHPGNPDPGPIGQVMDAYAANHNGLAPIVVVVDQVGVDVQDTGCVDSPLGKVRTYLLDDVVPWMRSNLNVLSDPRFWTIAGYSSGGQCAISLGAEHPEVFRGVVSVSGEEFPGSTNPDATLKQLFGGDAALFEQAKPLTILAHTHLPDSTAVFTAAKDDPVFLAVARKLAAAAEKAGMASYLRELPKGGHTGPGFYGGLFAGFAVMYPVWGLSEPGKEAVPAYTVS